MTGVVWSEHEQHSTCHAPRPSLASRTTTVTQTVKVNFDYTKHLEVLEWQARNRDECLSYLPELQTEHLENKSQSSESSSSEEDNSQSSSPPSLSPPTSISSDGDDAAAREGLPSSNYHVPLRPRTERVPNPLTASERCRDDNASTATPTAAHQQPPVESNRPTVGDRFAARRQRCVNTSAQPPKLRRDTENTDAIVRMIVIFCTYLIQSIWCSTSPGSTAAGIHGEGVLPLQTFITETLRRSKTSYSTLQVALYYLILLKQCMPGPRQSAGESGNPAGTGCRAMQCGRRMFLTALILASKYLQDRNYSVKAWSKISGLPLKEINENERRYLKVISYGLHVPKAAFENWSKIVLTICRLSGEGDTNNPGPEHRPLEPGPGYSCAKQQTRSVILALSTWWQFHLRSIHLDVVKCPLMTERFVASICPFQPGAVWSPPVLRDSFSRTSSPGASRTETDAETAPECLPCLPSIDLLTKYYPITEKAIGPTQRSNMPPQPMLPNLPTPQTTPRPDSTRSAPSQFRCNASSSTLGNLGQDTAHVANMDMCPPPKPQQGEQAAWSRLSCPPCAGVWQRKSGLSSSMSSSTSSPETVVSEYSFAARSRSSSISSTSSWVPVQCNRAGPSTVSSKVQTASATNPTTLNPGAGGPFVHCPPVAVSAPRGVQNAGRRQGDGPSFGLSQMSGRDADGPSVVAPNEHDDEDYGAGNRFAKQSDNTFMVELEKNLECAAILASLSYDSGEANPVPAAHENSFDHEPAHDARRRPHKRAFSQTNDPTQQVARHALLGSGDRPLTPASSEDEDKHAQQPTRPWAMSKKPVVSGASNKRVAVQMPRPASAPELAAQYLRNDLAVVCR